MEKWLSDIIPIMGVEHDCILSKRGDITLVFEIELPELFTLGDRDYESLHHSWIKAIKVLPRQSVFHKQDWFTKASYKADFNKEDVSFLKRSSERYFNERPYFDHRCYVMLTKLAANAKTSSSLFSSLIRPYSVPDQTIQP